jgi:hypothetical protein
MSLDALLESVSQECQEPPDFEWTSEITETSRIENYHFASFHNFAAFPLANLGPTLSFEAELLSSDDSIVHRAQSIIQTIGNLAWDQISDMALLSWALHRHPDLLRHIPADSPIVTVVWCLAQCVHVDPDLVMAIWRERLFHPPPVAERIECQAVLLLLESCVRGFQPGDIPPFSSDEFETVFCLAYCSSRSLVPRLASWVLPQLIPLIVQSRAAHLVFRRILPYCVLQTKEGRRVATQVCEEIIGDHVRFPSCVSTWITMHRTFGFVNLTLSFLRRSVEQPPRQPLPEGAAHLPDETHHQAADQHEQTPPQGKD